MHALRIAPDTTVTDLTLPATTAHSAIRQHVGDDTVDQGVYHRRALLHIHGNGQALGLPPNLAAWALASAWRGMALYPLAGLIVVTGRTASGEVTALDDDLAQHVRAVAQTVRETTSQWHARPPASNEAAMKELLAYAARDVASPQHCQRIPQATGLTARAGCRDSRPDPESEGSAYCRVGTVEELVDESLGLHLQ